jgi:hypothetical protein
MVSIYYDGESVPQSYCGCNAKNLVFYQEPNTGCPTHSFVTAISTDLLFTFCLCKIFSNSVFKRKKLTIFKKWV